MRWCSACSAIRISARSIAAILVCSCSARRSSAPGLLASALTGNQVVAALISLSVFLLLWIIDNFGWLLPSPFDTLVVNLSLSVHFKPFAVGSIYLSDVGFFLSVALLTLLLSVRALARR